MKKSLLTFALLLSISLNLKSQIRSGSFVLGGDLIYSSFNTENSIAYTNISKSTLLSIRPYIGKYINENTLVGVGVHYEYSWHKLVSGPLESSSPAYVSKSENSILFVNVFMERYFEVAKKFYFTAALNAMLGFGRSSSGNDLQTKSDVFEYRFTLKPGASYFIDSKWSVFTNIGQLQYRNKKDTLLNSLGNSTGLVDHTTNLNFTLNFDVISLGVRYHFGK